ncbi:MAG: hypothetical protein K0R07_167 [Sedimentibacter sp.]|jgi:hypothetical protein|nr:hypothetical protein [Sedimentibacter sp.]
MITLEKILGALTGKENLYRCGRNFTAIEEALNNSGDVEAHNIDVTAHSDIRAQINDLDTQIGTIEAQTIAANYNTVNNIPTTAKRGKLDVKLKGMSAVNMIKNGNFATTDNWSTSNATRSVSGNVLTMLASAQYGNVYSYGLSEIAGHKYYASIDVKSDSNSVCLNDSYSSTEVLTYHTGSNQYEKLSKLFTSTTTKSSSAMFNVQDRRSSGWTNVYTKNARMVDLTAIYGAGNEPDLATCDRLFGTYFESLQGSTGIKAVSCGKNLFDKSKATLGAYVLAATGALGNSATYMATDYITVKSGSTYYFNITAGSGSAGLAWYDNNKNYISGEVWGTNLPKASIAPANAAYLRCSPSSANLDALANTFQIEEGTVATSYEPYKGTDIEYKTLDGKAITLNKLPNGVYDEITEDEKYVKRIAEKTLILTDVDQLYTGYTNIDVIFIGEDAFADLVNAGTADNVATKLMTPISTPANNTLGTFDSTTNVGKHRFNSSRLEVIVSKGTYANLAAAQASLAGTKIIYQLATLQILDTNAAPLIAEPGGQVAITSTSSPQTSAEFSYPTNVGAAIDGLIESQTIISESMKIVQDITKEYAYLANATNLDSVVDTGKTYLCYTRYGAPITDSDNTYIVEVYNTGLVGLDRLFQRATIINSSSSRQGEMYIRTRYNGTWSNWQKFVYSDEGSWTPILAGQTTAGTNTYSAQVGKYYKMGKFVHVEFGITMTAKDAAMAGNVQLKGLPFAASSGSIVGMATMKIGRYDNITFGTGYTELSGYVSGGTNFGYLTQGGSAKTYSALTTSNLASNSTLYGSADYLID